MFLTFLNERGVKMNEKLLKTSQVCELTALSRTSIWRLEKSGEFPRAVSVCGRRKAYVERHVREWIAAKIANAEAA